MNQLSTRLFPTSTALMDHVLRDFLEPPVRERSGRGAGAWRPQVDLAETEDSYLIRAELPGVDPAEVEITALGDTLTLKGEKRVDRAEGDTAHVLERRGGAFTRTFRFPAPLADDAVSATARDGVLTIAVAKATEAKPRRITIQTQG